MEYLLINCICKGLCPLFRRKIVLSCSLLRKSTCFKGAPALPRQLAPWEVRNPHRLSSFKSGWGGGGGGGEGGNLGSKMRVAFPSGRTALQFGATENIRGVFSSPIFSPSLSSSLWLSNLCFSTCLWLSS